MAVRCFIMVALIQPNQISELFTAQVKEYNSETVSTTLDKNGASEMVWGIILTSDLSYR